MIVGHNMKVSDYLAWTEITIFIISFLVMLGFYKASFSHHEQLLDRHEVAINKIIVRLDAMNAESNFMKGFVLGKINK